MPRSARCQNRKGLSASLRLEASYWALGHDERCPLAEGERELAPTMQCSAGRSRNLVSLTGKFCRWLTLTLEEGRHVSVDCKVEDHVYIFGVSE